MNPLLNKPSSNSPLINDALSKYVCSWLKDQKVRQDLIARIQYKKQKQQPNYQNQLINDQSLSQQYFKIWMQQPVTKPLLKLAMHPLLLVQDQKTIDQISSQQRNDQIKFSCQLTAGSIGFYWIFFSRMAKFQRFFNDRNKSKILNGTKKILAVYAVLIAWQASLSSHYEKKLPDRVNQKGLFKKYGIQFQDKNI